MSDFIDSDISAARGYVLTSWPTESIQRTRLSANASETAYVNADTKSVVLPPVHIYEVL